MASVVDTGAKKKLLQEALDDKFKLYLQKMKLWFQEKMTKEEFDSEARKLFTPETVHIHNDFLLAIFKKVNALPIMSTARDTIDSSQTQCRDKFKKGKIKKKSRPLRPSFEHRFQPASLANYIPQIAAKDPPHEDRLTFCTREGTLLNSSMMHGRMYVTAWDAGLDEVENDAVTLMMLSLRNLIKTILMSILTRRSTYKTREKRFLYEFGSVPRDIYQESEEDALTNSSCKEASVPILSDHVPNVMPTMEWEENENPLQLTYYELPVKGLRPISPADMFDALLVHSSVIPCHTVYSINMERIIAKLYHPTLEELEQEDIHNQEVDIYTGLKTELDVMDR